MKIIKKAKYRFYYDFLGELSVNSSQLSVRPEFSYFLKFLESKPVVVPVPLHATRLRERGFNQAEEIGKLVASHWSLVMADLLKRVRDTGHQAGREREERLIAVRGAFEPKTKDQLPKAVLLVDDVWTTGATLSECCKILKQNGAKTVWGLVLAR